MVSIFNYVNCKSFGSKVRLMTLGILTVLLLILIRYGYICFKCVVHFKISISYHFAYKQASCQQNLESNHQLIKELVFPYKIS